MPIPIEASDIPEEIWTEGELMFILKRTREENRGISLEKIAEIMCDVFDSAELEALIRCLKVGENN